MISHQSVCKVFKGTYFLLGWSSSTRVFPISGAVSSSLVPNEFQTLILNGVSIQEAGDSSALRLPLGPLAVVMHD